MVRGSDGFYTEYAHITPARRRYPSLSSTTPPYVVRPRPLAIGDQIIEGQLLGWVDNSGWTEGAPSIHIGRYTPGDPNTLYLRKAPCDWYIHRVDAPFFSPSCLPHGLPTFASTARLYITGVIILVFVPILFLFWSNLHWIVVLLTIGKNKEPLFEVAFFDFLFNNVSVSLKCKLLSTYHS